jgi:hypothetical protein
VYELIKSNQIVDFRGEIRVCTRFLRILPTLPREMPPRTCQQPAPRVPATNNAYGALADLSEDEISPSCGMRHGTNLGTYPSSDANVLATFQVGPAIRFVFGTHPTYIRDDALRLALSRHLTDGFTFMNGHIKGIAQNLKDAEGRHEEFRRQMNNHLNEMRAEDMDTCCTKRECFLWMENPVKTLLQQTDAYNRANEALLEAEYASHVETTLLRAEIETLMR